MRTKACYALNPHTTVSTFKALICQNALLPSEDVCDGIYGYSYILYIYRTLYIYLCWTGMVWKHKDILVYTVSLQETWKLSKRRRKMAFCCLYPYLSFLCLFDLSLWFFLSDFLKLISYNSNTNAYRAVLKKTSGSNFCTLPGNLLTYITSS